MEFQNVDETKEPETNNENSKIERDKLYFGCRNETEEPDYKGSHSQIKEGMTPTKPSDVRNGDLVSLLLAATPPYLYDIPLVPQTFFFSEMLKSFVQAKTERQNLKVQQAQGRRQRKRSWRELTPPSSFSLESKDKPLELTIPKQFEDKSKTIEKIHSKKFTVDRTEKKFQTSKFESSNFSVEKLANSSITTSSDIMNGKSSGDLAPPAPPLWYPLLYPPHPPYGIDPLHFFIDFRVSAHFWDRKLTSDKSNNDIPLNPSPPFYSHENDGPKTSFSPIFGKARHHSAFTVPSAKSEKHICKDENLKKNYPNVHYIISSLKDIYESLDKRDKKKSTELREETKEENEEKKCKDLRALIGLELVVDYFKKENDKDEEKSDAINHKQDPKFQSVSVE